MDPHYIQKGVYGENSQKRLGSATLKGDILKRSRNSERSERKEKSHVARIQEDDTHTVRLEEIAQLKISARRKNTPPSAKKDMETARKERSL